MTGNFMEVVEIDGSEPQADRSGRRGRRRTPGRLQRGLLRRRVLPGLLPAMPLHGPVRRPVEGVRPRERIVHQVPPLLARLHHG